MSFHDVRFPTAISLGSAGGPERRTEIVALASGYEERNTPWAQSRRRYDAGFGVRSRADLEALVAFFEARRGRLNGFRWRDPLDWRSSSADAVVSALDQSLGVGDGATRTFQLVKRYLSGAESYARPITLPVAGAVRVAIDGVETTGFTLVDKGVVKFDVAPAVAATLTAGYEFDVPVRFDTDRLSISLNDLESGDAPSIPVVEVRY